MLEAFNLRNDIIFVIVVLDWRPFFHLCIELLEFVAKSSDSIDRDSLTTSVGLTVIIC